MKVFIIMNEITYCSINDQNKIKMLTKIFTYLISKNIENIKFDYNDNKFIYNNTNVSNKLTEFTIQNTFFSEYNIMNKSILNIPILNIIKDLKSYKGKKIFPHVYFIFNDSSFTINSIYPEKIELSNRTICKYYTTSTTYKLDSLIQNKQPNILIDISMEKLNILLNNTYVKENSEILFKDNYITLNFTDTHGNNKCLKTEILNNKEFKISKIIIENFVIKDLMKFFKDNIIQFCIYCNEEKIIYNVLFDNPQITFKLISSIKIEYN